MGYHGFQTAFLKRWFIYFYFSSDLINSLFLLGHPRPAVFYQRVQITPEMLSRNTGPSKALG